MLLANVRVCSNSRCCPPPVRHRRCILVTPVHGLRQAKNLRISQRNVKKYSQLPSLTLTGLIRLCTSYFCVRTSRRMELKGCRQVRRCREAPGRRACRGIHSHDLYVPTWKRVSDCAHRDSSSHIRTNPLILEAASRTNSY